MTSSSSWWPGRPWPCRPLLEIVISTVGFVSECVAWQIVTRTAGPLPFDPGVPCGEEPRAGAAPPAVDADVSVGVLVAVSGAGGGGGGAVVCPGGPPWGLAPEFPGGAAGGP